MKDEFERDIRCEIEGKICYTEREANEALKNARHHGIRAKKTPKRKYFCKECGCFHLTSQKSEKESCSKRNYDMKRNKIKAFEFKKLWREEYSLLLSA
ncbi:hypothetical protein J6Y50_06410 [bacterium]|nr:hypothetical protein [bacterium]